MPKILVVAQPEPGHILPMLPILESLRQKGHDIIVMASAQTRWLPENSGFRVEVWVDNQDDHEIAASESGYSFWYRFTQRLRIPIQEAIQCRLESVARIHEPDFYIFDSLFTTSYGIDCGLPPYFGRCSILATLLPRWDMSMRRMPSPFVLLCPSAFEIPRFVIRHPMVHYAEPSCSQAYQSEQEIPSGRPLVLATFGTQTSLQSSFLTRIKALNSIAKRHSDVDFIIGMGARHLQVVCRQDIETANNIKLRSAIPQQAILKHASAFITHGGLSSVKEAILHGVPMIVTPEVFDQPFNALRAEHHGLATAIFPKEMTAGRLEAAVMKILDRPRKSEAVETFRRLFLKSLAQPKAARLIEEQLCRVATVRGAG